MFDAQFSGLRLERTNEGLWVIDGSDRYRVLTDDGYREVMKIKADNQRLKEDMAKIQTEKNRLTGAHLNFLLDTYFDKNKEGEYVLKTNIAIFVFHYLNHQKIYVKSIRIEENSFLTIKCDLDACSGGVVIPYFMLSSFVFYKEKKSGRGKNSVNKPAT